MPRRPWPIVILASFQIFAPFLGLLGASLFHQVSVLTVAKTHWELSTAWQLIQIYLIPIIIGVALYSTRKNAYYISLAGCVVLLYRDLSEFFANPGEFSLWLPLWSNVAVLVLVIYLLNPKVRRVFFDPTLRWWHAPPRYIVSRTATIRRAGGEAFDIQLQDLSLRGAGIESSIGDWKKGEDVTLSFEMEGAPYSILCTSVYAFPLPDGRMRIGLKWDPAPIKSERSRIRRLLRAVRRSGAPEARQLPHWWADFKEWLHAPTKVAPNPRAAVVEKSDPK